MTLLKKFWAFVNQDVADENESKKTTVLMRIFVLLLIVYLIAQMIFLYIFQEYVPMTVSGTALVFYLISYAATYKGKTNVSLIAVQVVSIGWIVSSIWMLGWDCGVQLFLLTLLILVLYSGHQKVLQKVIMAVIYLGIRLSLYVYSINTVCMYPLTRKETMILQTINSIAIYAEIAFLSVMFAKEAQASERKLVSYNKKIKEMAFRDPLTKLRNRRSMLELLQENIKDGNEYICVAIADIDFFKKVNDTYGHEAGDEVLKHVAKLLEEHMKHRGYVARWGGEEFLFLFKNGNGDEAKMDLERIRSRVEESVVRWENQDIQITMTFGLVEYRSKNSLEENISHADQKLYSGKKAGRNRVVF